MSPQAAVPTLAAPKSVVMKDHVATTQRVALLADARPARRAAGRARRRRRGARRPRQLAARRGAGAQREDRDSGVAPASTPSSGSASSPSRRRSSRASIRRVVEKRLDELVAEFIANGPTEDEVRRASRNRGRRPDPRARAGRRLRRQGGHAGRRARPMPATANGMPRTLATYASVTPGRRSRRRWASG